MPKHPGVSHRRAVRTPAKMGFRIVREDKNISMTDGERIVIIPRANPINAPTMVGIIIDAGLTVEEFQKLL